MNEDDIELPRADLEYILSALKNAESLSLTHDYLDQVRTLKASVPQSKLTKMIAMCISRVEDLLKEEDDGDQ